jgi:hypothetical protein
LTWNSLTISPVELGNHNIGKPFMFSLARHLLVSGIVLCVPFVAYARPKADAGSGPTNGATSTNDAGSGRTPGAKPNTASADSTGVTTGANSQSNSEQMQKGNDLPPGDAQTGDKRAERASKPAPLTENPDAKPADAQEKK